MLRALYGMLVSSILYYKKFRKDIEAIGFEVNPYDICVANRTVNGKHQTLTGPYNHDKGMMFVMG